MKHYIGIAALLFFFSVQLVTATTIPNVMVLNSTGAVSGMPAVNVINGSGMSVVSTYGTHDNSSTGATMWTSNYQWSDITITFDLGIEYNVNKMYVWNFNQQGFTTNGMKNAQIQYSLNNITWSNVAPPVTSGYTINNTYPFQFTQASGSNSITATNLNDGSNTPLTIGLKARYIRIVAPQIGSLNGGNWGGATIGLSEVVFTTDDNTTAGYRIDVDAGKIINTCGNLVFGGCQSPSYAQSKTILPLLVDAGMNFIRGDLWIESIVPALTSVDDYYNNVNDCQNADKWDYSNVELFVLAKKAGMKTMLIVSYCPPWLAYNGKTNGVPKDMNVYCDILRKIYSRYSQYVDYVEFYNEPGYFFTVESSPYTSVGKALADMYIPCYNVIQSITPGKPMGGLSAVTWSDGGVGGSTNTDFFGDSRINTSNFNFYSHHVYGDYGIETSKETVTRVKTALSKFGFGSLPVYFTEWSTSINSAADTVTYIGTKSHTFVGKCLVNWMRDGLTGANHWNFMQAVAINAPEAGANADGHGMYAWNSASKTGYLLPKAYVFKMMSRSLGLGKGLNSVLSLNNSANQYLNMVAFTNIDGVTSVVAVNESTSVIRINIGVTALTDITKVEQYNVTYSQKGEIPTNPIFSSSTNGTSVIVEIPASSVAGIKFIK